jgi:hypothetical protein
MEQYIEINSDTTIAMQIAQHFEQAYFETFYIDKDELKVSFCDHDPQVIAKRNDEYWQASESIGNQDVSRGIFRILADFFREAQRAGIDLTDKANADRILVESLNRWKPGLQSRIV